MRVHKFLLIKYTQGGQKTLKNFKPVKVVVPDFIPEDYNVGAVLDYFCNINSNDSHHDILIVEDNENFKYDWDSVSPVWLDDPKDFNELIEYVRLLQVRTEHFEHIIKTPTEAMDYIHELDIQERCFEDIICKDDEIAYEYMTHTGFIDGFDGWWTLDEVVRSPVWIYYYAKKHGYNEILYNAMMVIGLGKPDNKYFKKFMNTRRFVPKESRKNILSKVDMVRKIVKENQDISDLHNYSWHIRQICNKNGIDVSISTIKKVLDEQK